MSNKPKIYGNCKAGCQWETVHKSDFEKSASHILVRADENGVYWIEKGKEYKVFADKDNNNQFACQFRFIFSENGSEKQYIIAHENNDKYADNIVFRFLEASVNTDATEITVVYEMAGIRYTETINGTALSLLAENDLYITNATKVLLYNYDATIVAKGEKGDKGDKGEKGADGKDHSEEITLLRNDLTNIERLAEKTSDHLYKTTDKNVEKNTNKIRAVENALIKNAIIEKENGYIDKAVQQTGGTQLEGLTILDDSYVTVKKIQGDTVKCENLIPYPYVEMQKTSRGVTFTTNEDGSITINGTNDKTGYSALALFTDRLTLPPGTYTVSGISASSGGRVVVQVTHADGTKNSYSSASNNGVVEIIDGDKITYIEMNCGTSGATFSNETAYPMLNKGGTALPYQLYFKGLKNAEISGIKSTGRNLIPYPYYETTKTMNGITFTDNGDGGITLNGTSTAEAYIYLVKNYKLPEGIYSIGGNAQDIIITSRKNDTRWIEDGASGTFNKDDILTSMSVYVGKGRTINNETVYPMFNIGSTALPFEPYTESVMELPQLELGKWDYIKDGQVVEQTIIEAFDSTKYSEEDSTYNGTTDFVLSADGSQVAYKSETPTKTDIAFDNEYAVWDKGTEKVFGNDNAIYGANVKVENTYIVLVGGTE